VQLRSVPLGIGSLHPSNGPATGGTTIRLRGRGFQGGTKITLGGKAVAVTFKDMNTLTFASPAVLQQLVVTNPDGESTSLDAAFTAN
jgi:hypothetical protein